jgi:hypothetical protein
MFARCYNPDNKDYPNYGGRGIEVCNRWNTFENFLSDMGEKPDRLTLDRIDNDKGYEPSNCKWSTRQEQVRNSCNTLIDLDIAIEIGLLRLQGELQETIADKFGVSKSCVADIFHGRTWKEAMGMARDMFDHVGEVADNSTGEV